MEKTISLQRKNYWSLDVAKFICALLIISAHFATEWGKFPTFIDYGFSIYVIAVPFFFSCSAFLFFKKWLPLDKKSRREYLINYQKRIWIMYGCWTAVYFPFLVVGWIKDGVFGLAKFLDWLHMAIVFQTYATIWFLPALAVGIAVTCLLVSRLSKKTIAVIAAVLYVFGMLGYTYKFLIDGTVLGAIMDFYLIVFKTSRNGLFNAVPFIFIGFLFADKQITPNRKVFLQDAGLSVISLTFVATESFLLKIKFGVTGMDIGIFLVPFTYFFIKMLLNLELKENKLWLWCRKLSLLMFVSQRLFLTALPLLLPTLFGLLYSNSYIGLLIVLFLIIAFSILFIKFSEKVKVLKIFI